MQRIKTFRNRWAKPCLAGAIIAAAALTSACSKSESGEAEKPPAPVQVAPVKQATMRRIVSGDGVLFPRDQASIMPKISAPVRVFRVNRGDHVKQGQLLAELENRDLTAQAAAGASDVQQAEANARSVSDAAVPESVVKAQTDVDALHQAADAARKVLESREQLLKEGALARRQVDESQVAYAQANSQYLAAREHLRVLQSVSKQEQIKSAEAQTSAAKARHQTLEVQLAYSRITSPISGVISDRPLYEGELASPGTALLTVMDISSVVARVNVPQEQAALVRAGEPATIKLADSQEEVPGKVTVVSPATDPNSTTVQVWVQAENPGERLKPGSSVHVDIVAGEIRDAMAVPASAILPGSEGGTAILAVDGDSIAHLRSVKVGVREGDRAQLLNGVKPGESVVISGGLGVEDKAKVRIVKPGEGAAETAASGKTGKQ